MDTSRIEIDNIIDKINTKKFAMFVEDINDVLTLRISLWLDVSPMLAFCLRQGRNYSYCNFVSHDKVLKQLSRKIEVLNSSPSLLLRFCFEQPFDKKALAKNGIYSIDTIFTIKETARSWKPSNDLLASSLNNKILKTTVPLCLQ